MDFRTRISLDGMGPEATTQMQSQPSPAVYPGTGKESMRALAIVIIQFLGIVCTWVLGYIWIELQRRSIRTDAWMRYSRQEVKRMPLTRYALRKAKNLEW